MVQGPARPHPTPLPAMRAPPRAYPLSSAPACSPSLSRRHAVLMHRAGRPVLRDLASAHGTFVNGRRLRAGGGGVGEEVEERGVQVVLTPGDVIRLGAVGRESTPEAPAL